ncbi:16S rRNA processing protein RimM [Propionicimonas paludicola]|uniref:Ribosome maturation factor RimM n=1 Tax=Propionicimonas paludicola TaxID=185243 RepID=A0A2A9CQT9_9ACTN|nr:ribosome maturation factor RimM [Propionicimonas paludicola]PFG16445.1 16S rRNA processing protein RimM [Propionicimonas paludicola]
MSEQVIVGTIGRAHGLRGQVTVRPQTDSVEQRFAAGATVRTSDRTLTVTGHSWLNGVLLVAFDGVGDRTSAEALRGLELWAEGIAEPTEPDEYADLVLIGMDVVDPDGAALGTLTAVQHNPAQDLLVVRTPDGDRMVPFVEALVPEVDLLNRRIVVIPIPGLLTEVDDAD